MKVIITIPAYNEEKTIGKVLRDIKEVMDKSKYSYRLLVVDDGSKDKTKDISKANGAIVVSHPMNYGLAETFRTEIRKCLDLGADVIVHIDADGQYVANEIPKLLGGIEKGYDLVLGSRFKGKIEYMPLIKKLGNIAFSKVISHIAHTKITDGQTGFRAFTKEFAKKIDVRSQHTYTQEQIIRAVKEKFKVLEIPVYFRKRGKTKSRLINHPFEYATKAWINILRVYRDYEPLKFFGRIGLLFLGAGVLLGLWLVYLFLTTGSVGRIPTTIFTILLITMGVQIILFGFLADMNQK